MCTVHCLPICLAALGTCILRVYARVCTMCTVNCLPIWLSALGTYILEV